MTDATIATLAGAGVAVLLGIANTAANVYLAIRSASHETAINAGIREAASHASDIRTQNTTIAKVAAAVPPPGSYLPAPGPRAAPLSPPPAVRLVPPPGGPSAGSSPPSTATPRPTPPAP